MKNIIGATQIQRQNSDFGILIADYEREHDLFETKQKINTLEHRRYKSFVKQLKQQKENRV